MSLSFRRHGASALLVALVTGAALLSPVGADGSSSSTTSSTPVERSGNSGYTWWTEPLMARTPGNFYSTGVTSNGTQRVYRWGRTKAKRELHLTYTNLRRRAADDHNAPAISMAKGRSTVVFYTGHPGVMYHRRTAAGANPVLGRKHKNDFSEERRMPFDRPTTYAQVLRDGPRMVVLSRYLGGGKSGWYYVTSQNSGRTWTKPAELFDSESHQAYLMVRPKDSDPGRLHVTAYYHPKRGPDNVIGYRELALSDFWNGQAERFTVDAMEPVWTSDEPVPGSAATAKPEPTADATPTPEPTATADPTPVPSPTTEPQEQPSPDVEREPSDDSMAPEPPEQTEPPVEPDAEPSSPDVPPQSEELVMPEADLLPPEIVPPSTRHVRMLDVGDKQGRTMVFGATWDATNDVPVYIQMIRRDDGTWSRHTIRSAGGGYGTGNGNYVPGLTLDDRPGVSRVYIGYKAGSRWNLAAADLGSTGRVGASRLLRQSTHPLARPITVGRDLMYQRLDRYSSYRSYFMRVKTFRLR
ncbi:BNR-4 repeat-containing protein [Aeromicrobium sp. CF4.19]|uniref:BNR-4 repeat-containing protein n=1 Tax=Aeromicrobium sp. CF4.19 TaxID=3373082 RepID=UPI003EE45AA5